MSLLWWFFFFSSRRRHTRCSRDWSSDVCSSDLRRLACALRHWARTPRQACLLPGCADRRSAPSLYREMEEEDRRCAPASRQRGGGALANQSALILRSVAQRRVSKDEGGPMVRDAALRHHEGRES